MTCDAYREAASTWYDGVEPTPGFTDLVDHVQACTACREFMWRLPRQVAVLRRSSPHFGDVRQERADAAPGSFRPYRLNTPLAVAAAIVLVIFTVAIQGNLHVQSTTTPEYPNRVEHASPLEGER